MQAQEEYFKQLMMIIIMMMMIKFNIISLRRKLVSSCFMEAMWPSGFGARLEILCMIMSSSSALNTGWICSR